MSEGSERVLKHLGRMVRSEVETAVSPWQAWLTWSDSSHLLNWLVDATDGEMAAGKTIRWVLAGTHQEIEFQVHRFEDGSSILAELIPSGQLVEIAVDGSTGSSLVSITHSGFADSDPGDVAYSEAISDWQLRVKVLKLYLGRYFGRARQKLRLVQVASGPLEEVRRLLLEPAGHPQWLTLDGELRPLREERVVLWDGTEFHSKILAATQHYLMFTWEECDAIVLFSCRPSLEGCTQIGIDISSWKAEPERLEAFGETLQVALSKLARSFDAGIRSRGSQE